MILAVLSFLLLLAFAVAQPSDVDGVTILVPEDFKNGIDAGECKFVCTIIRRTIASSRFSNTSCNIDDAIIDVRSQSEWDAGHIEGATLALNLAAYPSDEVETAAPADFAGCETCTIVVYCRKKMLFSIVTIYFYLLTFVYLCCRIWRKSLCRTAEYDCRWIQWHFVQWTRNQSMGKRWI